MRIKDVAVMNALTLPETTSGEYSFRYIDIGSVSEDGKVTLDEPIRFDEAPSRARRVVKRNDVLISTVRTYLKAIAPVDFDATDLVASTGFAVCTPTKGTHPRYLAYAVRSDGVIDEICKESCGISYPAINSTKLAGIEITYCDAELQRQIVAYLDEKFTVIDRIAALLEQKRTAYGKLKRALINETVTRGLDKNAELVDSGVDWIGAVPKGWTLRRLQDEYLYFKGLNITKDDLTDDGVPVVSYGQIHSKTNGGISLKDDLLRHVPPEVAAGSSSAKLKFGDYVFADTSEDIEGLGNCVLVDRDDGVFAGYHVLVARPCKVGCAKYIAYQFQCKSWRGQLQAKAFGIKVFSVTQRMLKGVEYVCPPISEQRRIADYLDRKCAAIDAAVENVTRQIELYRKLKRSLIDEVVTGRRKVA